MALHESVANPRPRMSLQEAIVAARGLGSNKPKERRDALSKFSRATGDPPNAHLRGFETPKKETHTTYDRAELALPEVVKARVRGRVQWAADTLPNARSAAELAHKEQLKIEEEIKRAASRDSARSQPKRNRRN